MSHKSSEEVAMIRKVAVAALAAAFALGTTPGFACTGISLKTDDGAAIRGRTLEMEGTKQPIADVSSDTTTLKAASR